MPDPQRTAKDHLQEARELIWEAVDRLEEAQRVLFRAGDRYVEQVWGDGVRRVLEITERMADISGECTSVDLDIGKVAKEDDARPAGGAA